MKWLTDAIGQVGGWIKQADDWFVAWQQKNWVQGSENELMDNGALMFHDGGHVISYNAEEKILNIPFGCELVAGEGGVWHVKTEAGELFPLASYKGFLPEHEITHVRVGENPRVPNGVGPVKVTNKPVALEAPIVIGEQQQLLGNATEQAKALRDLTVEGGKERGFVDRLLRTEEGALHMGKVTGVTLGVVATGLVAQHLLGGQENQQHTSR